MAFLSLVEANLQSELAMYKIMEKIAPNSKQFSEANERTRLAVMEILEQRSYPVNSNF